MGFWVFGSKIKNTGFSPPFAPFAANHTPGPSAGARARFFAAQNPGKLLCNHQVCCCFASLSDPRAVFFCRRWTCRSSRSFAVGQAPRTARGGGAGPPVRLLSLTSFSAGDLVPRPCMSSSPRRMAAPPVAFVCYVVAFRLPSCPRPFLLDWLLSFQQVLLYPRSYGGTGPPGPGEWACWTFLLTPTPCLTPSCDKRTRRGSCAQEEGAVVFLRGRKTSQGTPWGICAHGGCSLVPCRG